MKKMEIFFVKPVLKKTEFYHMYFSTCSFHLLPPSISTRLTGIYFNLSPILPLDMRNSFTGIKKTDSLFLTTEFFYYNKNILKIVCALKARIIIHSFSRDKQRVRVNNLTLTMHPCKSINS